MKTVTKLTLASGLFLSAFQAAQAATLFVDINNTCNALTPCYNSIQTAVTNAGPDDEIRVFPGTYTEVIDVSQMGSALGPATDGNITFIAVDANNAATPLTAQVSPATGIPFTHTGPFFNGNIVIDGFSVISTNDDGIDLDLVNGDITIRNMLANGNDQDGIDVEVAPGSHTITVTDSVTNNNGSGGLNLDGPNGTTVVVRNIQANDNDNEGIDIDQDSNTDELTVSISDVTTDMNGTLANANAGVVVSTRGVLTVNNLTSRNNEGPGIAIIDTTDTTVSDSLFESNGINTNFDGMYIEAAGSIQIERVQLVNNRNGGVWVSDTSQMGIDLTDMTITCSQFSGNSNGVYLESGVPTTATISVTNSNITGHLTTGMHSEIDNSNIVATDNWWNDATGPTHALNAGGMGDAVSDSNDVVIGSAMGVIGYTPFRDAPVNITLFASDSIFANGFDGNPCSEF